MRTLTVSEIEEVSGGLGPAAIPLIIKGAAAAGALLVGVAAIINTRKGSPKIRRTTKTRPDGSVEIETECENVEPDECPVH